MYIIKLDENFKLKFIPISVKRIYQYCLLLFFERSLYPTGSRSFGPEIVYDITMKISELVGRQVWFDQRRWTSRERWENRMVMLNKLALEQPPASRVLWQSLYCQSLRGDSTSEIGATADREDGSLLYRREDGYLEIAYIMSVILLWWNSISGCKYSVLR